MAKQSGSPYDCKTQGATRRQRACDQKDNGETGRISTHAFVKKSVNIRGLSGTALAQAILDAELACDAHVIREASGTYDGGADVTGQAGGRQTEKVTNTTHGLTGTDPEYVGNEKFWANMRATQSQYNYVGVTASRAWPVINRALSIAGKGPIGDDPTQAIQGEFTVNYNDPDPLVSVPIDIELLNQPPFLVFTSLTSNAANAATMASTAALETAVVAAGDKLDVTAAFANAAEYSIRGEDDQALPAGLAIDPITGVLTWTPLVAQVGDYLLYVRGESECGILGEVQLRITVTP